MRNAKGAIDISRPDLSLLSTYFRPADKSFVLSRATSAATAQAARLSALISAEYPTYWPEALRALVVHSAEWSAQMQTHLRGASGKRARAKLVQRYGFGMPSAARPLRSANDALTLLAQSSIRPFAKAKMSAPSGVSPSILVGAIVGDPDLATRARSTRPWSSGVLSRPTLRKRQLRPRGFFACWKGANDADSLEWSTRWLQGRSERKSSGWVASSRCQPM